MRAGLATDRWKQSLDDYVKSAETLATSMSMYGFLDEHAVPVDSDHELLDGSHRVACALAQGIETIPVVEHQRRAWAPPWDYEWFVANGMARDDLERVRDDWLQLCL